MESYLGKAFLLFAALWMQIQGSKMRSEGAYEHTQLSGATQLTKKWRNRASKNDERSESTSPPHSGEGGREAAVGEVKTTASRDEIRKAIANNLCRCTGYVQIVDAIEAAGDAYKD